MNAINKIKEFFVSMEMYQGRWAIAVQYRPKWMAYPAEDGSIKVGQDENTPDMWWYCANNDDVTVDDIINLIDETVQTNLEAIKKVELFKLKAGELKQLFSDETLTYKKLQTLKFVFDDSPAIKDVTTKAKTEQKKKVATKKDVMSQVGAEIQEHNVFASTKPTETQDGEELVVQKTGKRKRTQEQQIKVESVTPVEMTQEEIDSLRG